MPFYSWGEYYLLGMLTRKSAQVIKVNEYWNASLVLIKPPYTGLGWNLQEMFISSAYMP